MINGKTVLAVIPARGGSKGIPRKNIQGVAGKPLIAWTIEEANKSKYIDYLILSSEDEEIIAVAKAWDCEVPFVRPLELAQDETSGIDPVLHALREIPGYDYVVLLQPTSPLRSVTDIDSCIELCVKPGNSACVTVMKSEKSPFWMYVLDEKGKLKPLMDSNATYARRQDLPQVFALNGAVYAARTDWFFREKTFITNETVACPMPIERSVDIDTEFDLEIAQFLLAKRND